MRFSLTYFVNPFVNLFFNLQLFFARIWKIWNADSVTVLFVYTAGDCHFRGRKYLSLSKMATKFVCLHSSHFSSFSSKCKSAIFYYILNEFFFQIHTRYHAFVFSSHCSFPVPTTLIRQWPRCTSHSHWCSFSNSSSATWAARRTSKSPWWESRSPRKVRRCTGSASACPCVTWTSEWVCSHQYYSSFQCRPYFQSRYRKLYYLMKACIYQLFMAPCFLYFVMGVCSKTGVYQPGQVR